MEDSVELSEERYEQVKAWLRDNYFNRSGTPRFGRLIIEVSRCPLSAAQQAAKGREDVSLDDVVAGMQVQIRAECGEYGGDDLNGAKGKAFLEQGPVAGFMAAMATAIAGGRRENAPCLLTSGILNNLLLKSAFFAMVDAQMTDLLDAFGVSSKTVDDDKAAVELADMLPGGHA